MSFQDAVEGVTTTVNVMGEAPCHTCHGTGAAPGTAPTVCPRCGGRGVLDDNQGLFSFSQPCPTCGGRGVRIETPCPTCHGSGAELRARRVRVRIPPGVEDGQRIQARQHCRVLDLPRLHHLGPMRDAHMRRPFGVAQGKLCAAGIVAFLLSSSLQRLISGPILHLAQTARSITHEKNYGLRASKEAGDLLTKLMGLNGPVQCGHKVVTLNWLLNKIICATTQRLNGKPMITMTGDK